jgi:hypothetical protein
MSNELRQIELTIEQAQENIDKLEALDRLRKNRDWKFIIEEGYLKEEAQRLVLAKAEPALRSDDHQKELDNMIMALSYFRQYLNKLYQFGEQAKRAIEDHRQTRDEIASEVG